MAGFFKIGVILLIGGLVTLAACTGDRDKPPQPTVTAAVETGPVEGTANIESIEIQLVETFPIEVNVLVKGILPDECTVVDNISRSRQGGNLRVFLTTTRPAGATCNQTAIRFEELIALDVEGLPAGIYVVEVNGKKGTFTFQKDNVPDEANAVIGGRVWRDVCVLENDELANGAISSAGCVDLGNGFYAANGLFEPEETGLGGVLVNLGAGICPATGLANTITDGQGLYLFSGLKAGTYCVSIDSLSRQNQHVLQDGQWTYPKRGGPAAGALTLETGASYLDLNFGWQIEVLPPSTISPDACTDEATFVEDVTIPDDTELAPGEPFTKTWRLQNIGSCTWNAGYNLVPVEGELMGAPDSITLTTTTPPGATVDLSAPLVAPLEPGTYRGDWKIRNAKGLLFGIGIEARKAFWVQIVVVPD